MSWTRGKHTILIALSLLAGLATSAGADEQGLPPVDGPAVDPWNGPADAEGTPEALALPDFPEETPADAPVGVAPPAAALAGCVTGLVEVPGVGPACRTESGLWRTFFGDGAHGDTHGEDKWFPEDADEVGIAATRPVRCTTDPTLYYHYRAVYAYPSDKTSRYSSVVDTLRTRMREANYALDARSQTWGYHQDYIYRCASGTLSVASVQLPIKAADGTFSNIVQALKDKGYSSDKAKYVVYWDSSSTYCTGHVRGDSSTSTSNSNNVGPAMYSVMGSGGWTEYCTLHETFHNVGAVQLDAPRTSGGWHCDDGYDYMCYDDGAVGSDYYVRCNSSTRILDCGVDDYCHPGSPSSSNYLSNHWNVCHDRVNVFYKYAV